MKKSITYFACAISLGFGLSGSLQAQKPRDNPLIVQSEAFLNSHPDLKYRNMGMSNFISTDPQELKNRFYLGLKIMR